MAIELTLNLPKLNILIAYKSALKDNKSVDLRYFI